MRPPKKAGSMEQAYFSTIISLAEKEPCIIVGRAADYILRENKNRISFFITADKKSRIARIRNKYGITEAEAVKMIEKMTEIEAPIIKV